MAKKVKYKFNPETLAYEVDKISAVARLKKALYAFLSGSLAAVIWIFLYSLVFPTPKEIQIRNQGNDLKESYMLMQVKLNDINDVLNDIKERDNKLYRAVFEEDSIPSSIREAGMGGTDRYIRFDNLKRDNKTVLVSTAKLLDKLQKKAYIQSKSFDLIASLASDKTLMQQAMPITPPVDLVNVRFTSPFGGRSDPKYGDYRMHDGIDLAGSIGLAVHATGSGRVIKAGYGSGYGNLIEIDHKYGYTTRYAHLSAINVSEGQTVTRGQVIGQLGNTGKSTGPHLHYEVRLKGVARNPLLYFENKLDNESEELLVIDAQPYGDEN